MARRRHRTRRLKTRKHRNSRNVLKKTLDSSVSVVKSTSKRYMPKVKSGLENVGSNVVNSGKRSVPYLQKMTRKLFSTFTKKR